MNPINNIKSTCLLVACGHDAKRDDPLDPQLTPPVEFEIAVDETADTATTSWKP